VDRRQVRPRGVLGRGGEQATEGLEIGETELPGNGDGKFEIGIVPLAEGWVRFRAGIASGTDLARVPALLNETLIGWLRDRPNVQIRTTLPIVQGCSTVAIHVWFDV
jgi:hypothetical protein